MDAFRCTRYSFSSVSHHFLCLLSFSPTHKRVKRITNCHPQCSAPAITLLIQPALQDAKKFSESYKKHLPNVMFECFLVNILLGLFLSTRAYNSSYLVCFRLPNLSFVLSESALFYISFSSAPFYVTFCFEKKAKQHTEKDMLLRLHVF